MLQSIHRFAIAPRSTSAKDADNLSVRTQLAVHAILFISPYVTYVERHASEEALIQY